MIFLSLSDRDLVMMRMTKKRRKRSTPTQNILKVILSRRIKREKKIKILMRKSVKRRVNLPNRNRRLNKPKNLPTRKRMSYQRRRTIAIEKTMTLRILIEIKEIP